MKKFFAMLLLAALFFGAAGEAALAKGALFTAEVHADRMACYSRRSTSARYMTAVLEKGTEVEVLAHARGWAKIRDGKYVGYAKIEDMASHKRLAGYMQVSAKGYKEASADSKAMGTLPVNAVVYVVGAKGGFWLVESENGAVRTYVRKGTVGKHRVANAA